MIEDIKTYINNSNFKLIGIVGGAGAGKSTLTNALGLEENILSYSADHKFIGDSAFRKDLLLQKSKKSLESYIDACNQYNWWDWDSIYRDLSNLKSNQEVSMLTKYNRDRGVSEEGLTYKPTIQSKIVYEGALLGTTEILNLLDVVIFVHTKSSTRLNRLIAKDISRRSINEIIARFLITEYSESKHYELLFKFFESKIVIVDGDYNFITCSKQDIISTNNYIPFPI